MGIILKTESKNKGKTNAFVGTYISAEEGSFLSLVCTANGITKTEIIRTLFADWYEATHSEKVVTTMVKITAKKAYKVFLENKKKPNAGKKSKDFNLFCESLNTELFKKGISEDNINAILAHIKTLNT